MKNNLYDMIINKENYSPYVRPVKMHKDAVLLFMNLSLIQIVDVVGWLFMLRYFV